MVSGRRRRRLWLEGALGRLAGSGLAIAAGGMALVIGLLLGGSRRWLLVGSRRLLLIGVGWRLRLAVAVIALFGRRRELA